MEVCGDENTYNMNPVLLRNIKASADFERLATINVFNDIVDLIYYEVKYITPWEPGSHSDKSAGTSDKLLPCHIAAD